MSAVQLTVDDQGIALIGIDVPGHPVNVLTQEVHAELLAAVERIAAQAHIKGAILTSLKDSGFIAGGDLKAYVTAYEWGLTASQGRDLSRAFQSLIRRMETCGKPFAAAINGTALGGGLELALGCHYRVLLDDESATVGLPEVRVGLLPAGGGTQRLPRIIGLERAVPLMLRGTPVQPAEALKLGIVHALAPRDRILAQARDWLLRQPDPVQPWDKKGFTVPGGSGPLAPFANQLFMAGVGQLRRKTQGNLPAPLAILSAVFEGTIAHFDTGLRIEANYFGQLLSGSVAHNLMRTMFINRRQADKLVRRPAGIAKYAVKQLGIVGAGMMGAGISLAAANAGIEVILIDTTQTAADKGRSYSQTALAKQIQHGATSAQHADSVLRRIAATTDYDRLKACDFIIEAVFENRDLKSDVIRRVEAIIPESTIVATNTSTLPIDSLATASGRPSQFIGLHFFSPAERMPLLEVICGRSTSENTLARALDFAAQLKKTPIVVNDGPGFYTSRVFSTFIDEGACMLAEGVEPALIENAALMAGMPVGPLAQFDEVSQELSWRIVQQARADGLAERFSRSAVVPVLEKLLALGRRGRRYAGGFYEYPAGGKKHLWPGLAQHFPVTLAQPPVEELKTRLLTIQALEAARCVEDGVITNPADADLGSVLGIGFPEWTGGTLSYIDTLGLKPFVSNCIRFAESYGPRYQPSAWLRARADDDLAFYPRSPTPSPLKADAERS
jgi:3-hydroxyacyl-CoA dehydrogenase / enoyl-CoA hydratase / 3-hydroxybutyryl-CoA epimerase